VVFSDLRDQIAVVTGGARGLGLQMATALAGQGCHIALLDLLDEQAAASAAQVTADHGVRAVGIGCDVTDPESMTSAIAAVVQQLGSPRILLNAAGIAAHKDATEVTPDEWRRVIDIDLNGVFFASQAFARQVLLAGDKATIINVASMSAFAVNIPQRQASYNTAKAGVEQLTRSLAVEWIGHGIRVNAISPGYFRSDMTKQFIEANPEMGEFWVSRIPAGRMGEPEDLDGIVVFLASDASRYVVGECIVIDGGYTIV
jgi:NAD(P)-dependent dehydrogenase (short-subunit alcohol dehydrogenase family)